jgi:hypothetical protein
MRNTIRRLENLEQAYCVGAAQVPSQVIHVQYVAPDGEVTGGFDVVVGQPDGWTDLSEPRRVNRTDR